MTTAPKRLASPKTVNAVVIAGAARGSTDAELVNRMNKAEDCILYLRIQMLLTDGETDRIRRKINQRLIDASQTKKASP